MDVKKLQKILKKNDWIAADKETRELLCNITERSSEGFLIPEVIAQIPFSFYKPQSNFLHITLFGNIITL
jgi:hypothetical protein